MQLKSSNWMVGGEKLIETQQLRTFVVVSESNSFNDAAEKLGLTQPAVSQILKSLETRFDQKLVLRRTSPVQLTLAGQVLKHQALKILAEIRSIDAQVRESGNTGLIQCKIGMITSISEVFGSLLISELATNVERFTLRSGLTTSLKESFYNREIDILISNDPMNEVEHLERFHLFKDPISLVKPKGSSFLNCDKIRNSHVLHPIIKYGRSTDIGLYIELILRRLNIKADIGHETDDTHTLMSFIKAGQGWSLISVLCLAQCTHVLKDVDIRELDDNRHYRDIYLVAREGELGKLPGIISNLVVELLKNKVITDLQPLMPWLTLELFTLKES